MRTTDAAPPRRNNRVAPVLADIPTTPSREWRFAVDSFRPRGAYFQPGAERPQHLHIYHFPRFGDVDGDGELEVVYSKGSSGQVAYRLDGTELWRHFDSSAEAGFAVRCDSLVPIIDLDGDGRAELACWRTIDGRPHLCVVDAATGDLRHAVPVDVSPGDSHASLVPAQLDGPGRPLSLVLHRDYWRVEVYGHDLVRRWTADVPELGHTTTCADVDGDGRDELWTGTRLFRPDGTVVFAKPELLDGTGEAHPDSNPVVDVDGDGRASLVSAPGATLLDAGGAVRWRGRDMHEVQAVRTLRRRGRGDRLCALDLPRYQDVGNRLNWRGRRVPDVTARAHVFDADGTTIATFDGVHTPQAGDWDGDGDDELFLLAPDRRHVNVWRQDGSLLDRVAIQERVYISDMVVAPVLPNVAGCQLVLHEWSEDERRTQCVIRANPRAVAPVPPPTPRALAAYTCY